MIESVSPSDNDVMYSYSLEIFLFFFVHTFLQCWKVKRGHRKLRASFARLFGRLCALVSRDVWKRIIMQRVLASSALILSDFFENYYVYPFFIPDALYRIQNNFQDMQ